MCRLRTVISFGHVLEISFRLFFLYLFIFVYFSFFQLQRIFIGDFSLGISFVASVDEFLIVFTLVCFVSFFLCSILLTSMLTKSYHVHLIIYLLCVECVLAHLERFTVLVRNNFISRWKINAFTVLFVCCLSVYFVSFSCFCFYVIILIRLLSSI